MWQKHCLAFVKLKYEKLEFRNLKCTQSVRLRVKAVAGSEHTFSALRLSCESLSIVRASAVAYQRDLHNPYVNTALPARIASLQRMALKYGLSTLHQNCFPPRKFGAVHLICFIGFHSPPWWSHAVVKCCSTLLRTVTARQWTRWPQSVLCTWEQARRKDRDHAAGGGTAMDLAPCLTSSTRSGMLPTDAPRSADVEGLSIWCQQPLGDVFPPLQYPESLQAPAQHCTVWWEMGTSGGRGSTCCTLIWGNAMRAFFWKREVCAKCYHCHSKKRAALLQSSMFQCLVIVKAKKCHPVHNKRPSLNHILQ
ncbi:uncharacterized protein M6G45_006671 isoform 1-T1 [Spheniscus humboldti]